MSRRLVDGQLPERSKDADKGGRPEIPLTDEIQEKLCNALRAGSFLETACAFNRISITTIRKWVITGRQDPMSRHGEFLQAIEAAIAEGELRQIAAVDLAARGRPSEYEKEPVLDGDGKPILHDGKPLMQLARDKDGNPIKIRDEVRPDVKAAQWMLSRRQRSRWGDSLSVGHITGDSVLDASAMELEKAPEKEVISKEEIDRVRAKATRLLLQRSKFEDIDDA